MSGCMPRSDSTGRRREVHAFPVRYGHRGGWWPSAFGGLQAAALASIANAVTITDGEGRIVWVKEAFTTMSGYQPEEARHIRRG